MVGVGRGCGGEARRGWADEDRWSEIQQQTISAMERLDRALRPRIGALNLAALPEQEPEIMAGAVE